MKTISGLAIQHDSSLANKEFCQLDITDVVISRFEYEQFRHALGFCNFVSTLDEPVAAKVRQTITLTKLIDKANVVLDMKE